MAPRRPTCQALFKAWGVEYSPGEVVLNRVHALSINVSPGAPPARHPAILRLGKEDLKRDHAHPAANGRNLGKFGYAWPCKVFTASFGFAETILRSVILAGEFFDQRFGQP